MTIPRAMTVFPVAVDHAVDAGAVAWSFTLPEPTVTRTAPVATDHAVDAGAVAWTFAITQPSVTHTSVLPQDHAVDAGAVAWAFALPQPSVTHTPGIFWCRSVRNRRSWQRHRPGFPGSYGPRMLTWGPPLMLMA